MSSTATERLEPRTKRAPRPEPLSPEAWLVQAKEREPDLIADDDLDGLLAIAPQEVVIELARRHLGMIYSRIIHPPSRTPADRAATVAEASRQFEIFANRIYDRYAGWTKERGAREVGALAKIFASLKPRQKLGDALSREQFIARFVDLSR